jgi:uncharacterized protein
VGLSAAGIRPTFRLVANTKDVTATILDRFSSLRLTDTTGDEADTLEVVLADHDPQNPIRKPQKGAELELFLGYDTLATRMGLFALDEIRMGGWPGTMTLCGRAAIYAETPKGKKDFQTQFTQSWKAGTKLGDMVRTLAKRHGMAAAISASLDGVQLPHIQQDSESDINLLLRLAKRYDAIAKPAGGVLVFAKRGEAKTLSGQQLATVVIRPAQVAWWTMTESHRDSAGTVAAYYHAGHQGVRHEIKVGTGEPVKRIRTWFVNQAEALAAAKAALARANRAQQRLELRMDGHPDLMAEAPLVLQDFHPDVPANWIITRVVHQLDKGGGYTCEVSAELPNDPNADQYQLDTADSTE